MNLCVRLRTTVDWRFLLCSYLRPFDLTGGVTTLLSASFDDDWPPDDGWSIVGGRTFSWKAFTTLPVCVRERMKSKL